mgnify:CR=1 FL=1
MGKINNWADLRYEIADILFGRELDDAYAMGIREGATIACRKMIFDVDVNAEKIKMTPTEKKGYEKSKQVLQDTRKEIKRITGAKFL